MKIRDHKIKTARREASRTKAAKKAYNRTVRRAGRCIASDEG